MDEMTFIILKIVVSVSAALISAFVIPLLREKITDIRYKRLLDMVEVAVRAAEQTMGECHGYIKKDEVIRYVTDWMASHNVKITEEKLDQLIEAAVYIMNNDQRRMEK